MSQLLQGGRGAHGTWRYGEKGKAWVSPKLARFGSAGTTLIVQLPRSGSARCCISGLSQRRAVRRATAKRGQVRSESVHAFRRLCRSNLVLFASAGKGFAGRCMLRTLRIAGGTCLALPRLQAPVACGKVPPRTAHVQSRSVWCKAARTSASAGSRRGNRCRAAGTQHEQHDEQLDAKCAQRHALFPRARSSAVRAGCVGHWRQFYQTLSIHNQALSGRCDS